MDPGILIPVKGYGGHERLVEMFAKEYQQMGHEVHLLITAGSSVEGCVVYPFGREGFPPAKADAWMAVPAAWKFLYLHRSYYDLVHNFGRLAYLLPILSNSVKKIMTYGREISIRNIRWVNKLPNKNIVFTGCSQNLVNRGAAPGRWVTVHNAVNFNLYKLQENLPHDAPLIFLGRIEEIKGCHTAIAVAKATGRKLVIAGTVSKLPHDTAYFKNVVEPSIDGEQIQYVGPVNDAQKNEWLGKCRALLFPIEWEEPFGIVMVEAMACGTPVIGFTRGSVAEVIDEGITGYKVKNLEGMYNAVNAINNINRTTCRLAAMKRFDVRVIAAQYLGL